MYKSISTIVFLGALVAVLAPAAEAVDVTRETWLALCNGENLEFTLVSEVKALVKVAVSSHTPDCPKMYVEMLSGLEPVLDVVQEDACNEETIEHFRSFFERFMDNNDSTEETKLPQGLKNFVFGLGLNMASACKDRMLHTLLELSPKTEQLLGPRYYKHLFGKLGFLNAAFVGTGNYDELIESATIQRAAAEQSVAPAIQMHNVDIVRGYQSVCLQQLKPIYDLVLKPAVTMASLGFNFKSEHDMKHLAKDKQLKPWYRVIFFCEIINRFRFYELTKEDIVNARLDRSSVRLVSEEDIAKLDAIGLNNLPIVEPLHDPIESLRIPYGVEDEVLDSNNKDLVKEMNKLNGVGPGKLRRFAHSIKAAFKSGKRKLFGSLVALGSGVDLKGIKIASSKSNGPPRSLDDYLDEYKRAIDEPKKPGVMSKLATSLGIKPQTQKKIHALLVNDHTLTAAVCAVVLAVFGAIIACFYIFVG